MDNNKNDENKKDQTPTTTPGRKKNNFIVGKNVLTKYESTNSYQELDSTTRKKNNLRVSSPFRYKNDKSSTILGIKNNLGMTSESIVPIAPKQTG